MNTGRSRLQRTRGGIRAANMDSCESVVAMSSLTRGGGDPGDGGCSGPLEGSGAGVWKEHRHGRRGEVRQEGRIAACQGVLGAMHARISMPTNKKRIIKNPARFEFAILVS